MSEEIPLWERESLQREFKDRLALDNPEIIAREAVGMLNASGGTVWVGLRDDKEGRAVEVQPIPESEREKKRLLDFLVDAIEPSPRGRELDVRIVEREGGALLTVVLHPSETRKPYALLRKGGRHFVTRVGDRIRPMTREEIASRFMGGGEEKEVVEETEKSLRSELQLFQREQPDSEVLWLRLAPTARLSLDLNQLESSDLLIDPAATGNRRGGSTFLAARAWGSLPGRARESGATSYLAVGKPGSSELTVHPDGSLRFLVPLKSLHAGADPEVSKPLYPEALAEYPTSVFRLAAKLYAQPSLWEGGDVPPPDSILVVGLALLGLRGWSLRPGSPHLPGSIGHHMFLASAPRVYQEDDFILEPLLHFKNRDVCEDPDSCGFRLVRRIYGDAFLFSLKDLPAEFDRKTGRLVLPE
ncbi:MAG TPA: ATP-binding protein [Thermoanaerobaculia bacterium]|nr:ATP-binding protein [Thermoanaerobaculia bacterium]